MTTNAEKLEIIKKHLKSYHDFPKPGVLFRDIFSLLREPHVFQMLRDVINDHVHNLQRKPNCVVGLDSRGFLFGPIIALEFNIPFIPIRKEGKLPGEVQSKSYMLEYGNSTLEIQTGIIRKGDSILIVDDLLATGGTLAAACDLIEYFGAEVLECFVIMELLALNGIKKLKQHKVHSLIKF